MKKITGVAGQTNERNLAMKYLIAVLATLAVLAPSVAEAGKYSSKSKVTTCSSTTNHFGTKTICRSRG